MPSADSVSMPGRLHTEETKKDESNEHVTLVPARWVKTDT